MEKKIVTVLAGQPNCGKSTIFNMLTGSRQHVANYPGITVEQKTGYYTHGKTKIMVIDLPGTYSLTSYTQEEIVARNEIIDSDPNVIINIVDASNLERNLYLTFQLLEMEKPMFMSLNMMDVAEDIGYEISSEMLSQALGIKVIGTTAKKGKGKTEIYKEIEQKRGLSNFRINYGSLENLFKNIEERLSEESFLKEKYSLRWLALKLSEKDSHVENIITKFCGEEKLNKLKKEIENFSEDFEKPIQQMIATKRYETAEKIVEKVAKETDRKKDETITHKIDKIMCHRFFGPVILLGILYLFFQAVIGADVYIQPYWQKIVEFFREGMISKIPADSLIDDGTLKTLVGVNMIRGGMALFAYVPMFFTLFTLIGIMEDTGYMARIAFLMDKLLKTFGLHGQSALPMMLGGVGMGGCAIPGIMATRGIKDEKAKLITRLIVPILNCGAKIPFYLMIVTAFFPAQDRTKVLMLFYLCMLLIVLLVAKIFDLFVVKGENAPFILELPPYHMPNMKSVILNSCYKIKNFLKKILQVIIPFMAVMWVITYMPRLEEESEKVYTKKYQVLKEKFIKKAGSKNPYLDVFKSEESLVSYVEYSNFIKKKIRVIKDKEASAVNSLDKRYMNENNTFYEAMVLGDNTSIKDIEGYNSYVSRYRIDLAPIKTKSLQKLSKFSEKELVKSSDFYSVASKGKIYLDSEKLKQFKKYQKKYGKKLNSFKDYEIDSLKEEMKKENELFFNLMLRGKVKVKKTYLENKSAAKIEKSFSRTLLKGANKIKKARKDEIIANSFGGSFGKLIEPVTKLAGFDWRVNLAFISTFAAKENFVAVINGIFGISVNEAGVLVGAPWTKLNGICMMIALALFPPCIPTLALIKTETGKVRWMLFVTFYPIVLGFMISILVFQLGSLFGFA